MDETSTIAVGTVVPRKRTSQQPRPVLSAFALALAALSASPAALADKDGEKMIKKGAVYAARIGVGAAVGGRIGAAIAGGPIGAAVGVALTPSATACYAGEPCAKGAKVITPKSK